MSGAVTSSVSSVCALWGSSHCVLAAEVSPESLPAPHPVQCVQTSGRTSLRDAPCSYEAVSGEVRWVFQRRLSSPLPMQCQEAFQRPLPSHVAEHHVDLLPRGNGTVVAAAARAPVAGSSPALPKTLLEIKRRMPGCRSLLGVQLQASTCLPRNGAAQPLLNTKLAK